MEINALDVICPWCRADVGVQCDNKGRPCGYNGSSKPHPSRENRARWQYLQRKTEEDRQKAPKKATSWVEQLTGEDWKKQLAEQENRVAIEEETRMQRIAGPVDLTSFFAPPRFPTAAEVQEKVLRASPEPLERWLTEQRRRNVRKKRKKAKKLNPLKVDCPRCGAEAGQKCIDQRTTPEYFQRVEKPHAERVEAAKQAKPKVAEVSKKSYPVRCPMCFSKEDANIRLSKKNLPFIRCGACSSLCYINSPSGLSELEKHEPGPVLELLHDLSPSWRDSLERIIRTREKAAS